MTGSISFAMETYLYNTQLDDFVSIPLRYKILGRKSTLKYKYLRDAGININLIDYSFSGIIPSIIFKNLPFLTRKIFTEIEIYFWSKLNPDFIILRPKDLKKKYQLLAFSFKTAKDWPSKRLNVLDNASAVIMHLSHYNIKVDEKVKNLKKIASNLYLASDNNLNSNLFYKKFFDWYKREILEISFFVDERFFNVKKALMPSNQLLTTGTVDIIDNPHTNDSNKMFSIYKLPTLNRFRYELVNSKINLPFILNKISVREDRKFNLLNFTKTLGTLRNKKYFRINIAELMSEHKFYFTGSELSGNISLSNFEAAATGSVVLIDKQCKSILGKNSINFPLFDGTFEDLYSKLNLLTKDEEMYNNYSELGRKFVLDNFSNEACVKKIKNILKNNL